MHYYATNGEGNVTQAGVRDGVNDATCGVNIMHDVGRIFSVEGSQFYHLAPSLKVAHPIEFNEVGQEVTVEQLPDMHHARAFANVSALPDGKILITADQGWAEGFTDKEPVFIPELLDPETKTFTELASEAIPRNYHSISILLADGIIFSGGAGFCYDDGSGISERCRSTVGHPNDQIFTPPYLLTDAPKPVIITVCWADGQCVNPGGELRVRTEGSAEGLRFLLIKIGSVTRNINND